MEFNPFDPAFKANPYPTYAALREQAPVLLAANAAVVSRYDDVSFVLRNHELFSSSGMGVGGMSVDGRPTRSIISSDPPDHTQLRNMVNRAFTPRMVAEMEPRIREITRELLDRVIDSGEMDLVSDLAIPLPVTIIAEILGVDPARRADFKRWSNAIVGTPVGPPSSDTATAMTEFRDFFADAIAQRRSEPRDDMISALVRAEEQDATLTNDEIIGFAMLLLIAGNETTTNLLGNAVLALTEYPEQLRKVMDDRTLIPNMVEEALRYDSPVQFLFRTATKDVDLAGTTIPAGTSIVPLYASANRDDRKFPDAHLFDVTRNTQGHIAFGLGIHFCLGAPLARLEAKVAFEELFARVDGIERATEPTRIDSLFLRGLHHLPLRFAPVAAAHA